MNECRTRIACVLLSEDATSTQSWTGIKGGEYLMPENLEIGWAIERKTDQSGYKRPYPYEIGIGVDDSEYADGQVTDAALAALRMLNNQDNPFFLAVGLRKPHLPFAVPEKYWNMYDADSIKLADNPNPPGNVPPMSIHNWPELRGYYAVPPTGPVSPEMERMLVHAYYACVSYADALVGKLIQGQKDYDLYDNTIVILWGDHGWKLGDYSDWCKNTNFEIDTHVPLILRVPEKLKKGIRTKAIVELVDIYPSLCELAQIPIPDHVQGESFAPLLRNPDEKWKNAVFSQFPRSKSTPTEQNRDDKAYMGYSIRTDRYRFTRWVNQETVVSPGPLVLQCGACRHIPFHLP